MAKNRRDRDELASELVGGGHMEEGIPAEGLTDEDAVPDLPQNTGLSTRDIWIVGNHRLLVGDATNGADVATLMAGEAADLVFVDPPYNVAYEGYTSFYVK
jgi:hypothetical protein